MKEYYWHHQIGKAKYVVSYHDGVKKHPDGSPFYDINICRNKVNFNKFIKKLAQEGYRER